MHKLLFLQHPGVITVDTLLYSTVTLLKLHVLSSELTAKLDPATGQVAEENPDFLKTGNTQHFVKVKTNQTYGNRKR